MIEEMTFQTALSAEKYTEKGRHGQKLAIQDPNDPYPGLEADLKRPMSARHIVYCRFSMNDPTFSTLVEGLVKLKDTMVSRHLPFTGASCCYTIFAGSTPTDKGHFIDNWPSKVFKFSSAEYTAKKKIMTFLYDLALVSDCLEYHAEADHADRFRETNIPWIGIPRIVNITMPGGDKERMEQMCPFAGQLPMVPEHDRGHLPVEEEEHMFIAHCDKKEIELMCRPNYIKFHKPPAEGELRINDHWAIIIEAYDKTKAVPVVTTAEDGPDLFVETFHKSLADVFSEILDGPSEFMIDEFRQKFEPVFERYSSAFVNLIKREPLRSDEEVLAMIDQEIANADKKTRQKEASKRYRDKKKQQQSAQNLPELPPNN